MEEDDKSSESNDFITKLANNPGLWFVLIVGSLLVLFSAYFILGEVIYYSCGISILPIPRDKEHEPQQERSSEQAQTNQSLDLTQDDTFSREIKEALQQKRREKYRTFLVPYTKVSNWLQLSLPIDISPKSLMLSTP
jgi:hypothetical protein